LDEDYQLDLTINNEKNNIRDRCPLKRISRFIPGTKDA